MEATLNVLMLTSLVFDCYEPMVWWQSWRYALNTRQGKAYFSSSHGRKGTDNDRGISDMEVPLFVLEDLSASARAGGAVGSPKWENAARPLHDAPTYHYDLYWTDGTQTGPGTAAGHILKYLRAIEKTCTEAALQCETPSENAFKEIAALLKEEPAQPSAGKPAPVIWTCAICGGTESTDKFCMECGAVKT